MALQGTDRDAESANDAQAFVEFELAHESSEMGIDRFSGYHRRFEQWTEQRRLLRRSSVSITCPKLELTGMPGGQPTNDLLLLAACEHCSDLQDITVRHGHLHNSTLATLAQRMQDRLRRLDLTGTKGFDDLGLKALAAYCTQLESLRLSGCRVTDEGLLPVMKCCKQLREVEVSDITSLLIFSPSEVHEDCNIKRTSESLFNPGVNPL